MRNFDYLKDLPGLESVYGYCSLAEEFQVTYPEISAGQARRALESIVHAIYEAKGITIPERASLMELVEGAPFRDFIANDRIMMAVHYVRKIGNNGSHNSHVSKRESFFALLNIYNIVGAILLKLGIVEKVKTFDKSLIPNSIAIAPPVAEPSAKKADVSALPVEDKSKVKSSEPVEELPAPITEAETRRLYIDLMLKEAGWEVLSTEGAVTPLKACIEVKVKGMPNNSEEGFVDYVLFGSDGMPLALIEAKRTSLSPTKGEHQAKLYAECLEKQYGRRPVIYYSNGFQTWIIDGLGYPARPLHGFHTAEDLERLIQQRGRHNITDLYIKPEITDRAYQKMGIKAVCEHFNKMHRKGLLVMATGTGKTRTAISLVDVLMRNGWVKNVLFLADRISLVKQAHRNFVKLLPHVTTAVLSEKESNPDPNARIVFSTYQTMINHIDTEEKLYSVGHFDLIIIDEAHRSIFGKYGAIFHYFDALMIGLTATPRDQIDKNTYDIFEMDQGVPNYAYELGEAIDDGFLVPPNVLKKGTVVLREGIRYDNLSDEEKDQMETIWEYERAKNALNFSLPAHATNLAAEPYSQYGKAVKSPDARDIDSNEIFTYIFNVNTIDLVLQTLMNEGLKVQSGERIGKTVIFAYNHAHAELIVQRFNILYPEYGPSFCALIDNYVDYAQNLIERFEVRDGDPQIAVSVDMLDTGIDVPDILNLVFFKRVKSKIKFQQMIGRGTRLSSDIFGPGNDKKFFIIFDWCANFDYFDQHANGQEAVQSISLTERLFGLRAEIAMNLQHQKYQADDFAKGLHDELKALLQSQVSVLSDHLVSVRHKWESVSKFKKEESWKALSELDVWTLKGDIAPLIPKSKLDENAKKFDVLMLLIELSLLDSQTNASKSIQKVRTIAENLQHKASLPQVQAKMDTINEVLNPVAWDNVSLNWLEKVRTDVRELVKFLIGSQNRKFVIDIDDVVIDGGTSEGVAFTVSYKQKVMDFLRENRNLPVLRRIYNLQQLSSADIKELERILWEELGNKEDYDKLTNDMAYGANVGAFIRSMMGVDRAEAVKMFGDFITGAELNSEQEEFLKTIVNFVCQNGDIDRETVVNESPFNERLSVFRDYMIPLRDYIDRLHDIILPDETMIS